jgi:hypothetical protein
MYTPINRGAIYRFLSRKRNARLIHRVFPGRKGVKEKKTDGAPGEGCDAHRCSFASTSLRRLSLKLGVV